MSIDSLSSYWLCLRTFLIFDFGPLSPEGVPGEGPDCHFPEEIDGFGLLPARNRGASYIFNFHFGPKRSWVILDLYRSTRPGQLSRTVSIALGSNVVGESPSKNVRP